MLNEIIMMFVIMILAILALACVVILVTMWIQDRPFCARCATRMTKKKLVKFMGVDMCEPCENIAHYHNQVQ